MAWRQVEGSLGEPAERHIPAIPARWRMPALAVTVIVCIALFTAAVLIGIHG